MLKSQRLTAVVLIAAAIFLAACQSAPTIVGKWNGSFLGQTVVMEFTDKGTCTATSNGQTIECTYTVDTSAKPFKLDLSVKDAGTVQTIIEFVDAKTMKMENSDVGKPRPTAISNQSATFTKQ
jgi:hypothetical protein